ncbi:MAG: SRPBCC family protein [Chloroflexi bacterium]|nr:SRPBCC family protein [Chloroflexota bacterium]
MTQVSSTITINESADAIWLVIGDFGAACSYLVGFLQCNVEGEGVGARRTLTNRDSGLIVERLESWNEDEHRLSYALLTDTPFRNCLTTMVLRELGLHRTELEWSTIFQVDGLPTSEAVELMEGALEANCVALKQIIESR